MRRDRRSTLPAVAVLVVLLTASCGGRDSDDGGGSTDTGQQTVGITDSAIKVGNVATLSGPVPGLFQGAPNGVEAFFAYKNSEGGVNGRTLELVGADDALNCNENTKKTEELVDDTFALVGSFSVFDNCGAKVLSENSGVPNVSYTLSADAAALENAFSPQPSPPGFRTGPFQYYKDEVGATKVGILYAQSTSPDVIEGQIAAMESVGLKVVYKRAAATAETDFTSDVIRMRDAGADYLYLGSTNNANIGRVVGAARQQGWNPKVIDAGPAYDARFFDLVDPKIAEGIYVPLPFAMFLGEDRESTPAVDTFLTWVEKAHPGFKPDLFTLFGWASAQLFVEGLEAAGDDPTRADLLEALAGIDEFDADGLLPAANVGDKEPPICWGMAQVRGGKFVRVLPEDKGFTCEPGGYHRLER